nr:mitochondrial import inner membrane translocase subunit Tim9 isoform X2 [Manis javanica]
MREALLKYGLFSLPPESQVPGRGRQAAGGRLRFGKLAGSRRRPPSVRKQALLETIQAKLGQLFFQNRKETHASEKDEKAGQPDFLFY